MEHSTADLFDQRGDELDSCATQLRSYGGRAWFCGPMVTVRCLRDNVLLDRMLETPGEGRVLVVDGGGVLDTALMGDRIAGNASDHGWQGVVIHGAVRDVAALRELDVGIRALGSNPRKSAKDGAGEVDVPLAFGGATFTPGAMLWADEDGILVERA